MTAAQKIVWDMLHQGPYSGFHAPACGFCSREDGKHFVVCAWPKWRDSVLAVWPEWTANLNDIDMQEILDREHAAEAAEGGDAEYRDL
jgi:hypothetical protein